MAPIKIGILTVSDTCYKDNAADKSGPLLKELVTDSGNEIGKTLKGTVIHMDIVKDEEKVIMKHLVSWSKENVDIILTTGGTGFSKRDVTPEATKKVIHKEAPGLALAMLMSSLEITPMAMLSRAVCGIRDHTLIINLPGSPKAARECLASIATAIPHAIDIIQDNKGNIMHTHKNVQSNIASHDCHHKQSESWVGLENVTKRFRESPYPMVSVESAVQLIYESVKCRETEIVPAQNAHGRVLADNVYSSYDLPPFRASIKDGYAVLASDGKGKRQVLGSVKAGYSSSAVTLSSGTCIRVNTGAPVPDDATAVVQVEDTELIKKTEDEMEELEINILTEPKNEQDIRSIGCDIEKGSLVLKAFTKIGAAEMGLLAACGCTEVTVIKLPRVGVLSTGDELQSAGEPLIPGHVYDSNKITLMSMYKENGFDSKDMGIAKDDEDAMRQGIKAALEQVDVLVTSGSVSMGDKDMLKPVLEKYYKAKIHFGRVNMKPGKPTTFATCIFEGRTKYLLCLPGNPVSATVTSHLFVLPLLNHLHGINSKPVIVKTKLTSSYTLDSRPEYARAILDWDDAELYPLAHSTGNQISSKLLSCRNANALLMFPGRTNESTTLKEGDLVRAMLLGFNKYVV